MLRRCKLIKLPTSEDVTRIEMMSDIVSYQVPADKLKLLYQYVFKTQESLARALGCHVDSLKRWKTGRGYPTPKFCMAIDKLFRSSFTGVQAGQIRQERQKRCWVAARYRWEQKIGIPARPKGGLPDSRDPAIPARETDSRLHPICSAVERALRLGYSVPSEVQRKYDAVMSQ